MAPTITTSQDLISHFSGYVSIIGLATTTAADLAPYFAPAIQLDGKTLTVEEFRAIIPPNTEITAERFAADVENRILAMRLRVHVPATGFRMIEHVMYELDEQWRTKNIERVYAVESDEGN
ncbi:hypothetical protein MSAN_01117900 [Mycena sanguinolenta]|uniref:Uncharacterized protein n=1 Tax=Mycena sanguinolenta TaxID=230812 RepID=A0A8H7D688_9AGAR|nr:hypothetical protein MSAN_01117900 [Mycena sanguinolenta]